MVYEDLKKELAKCANGNDPEADHVRADEILTAVALHTGLSKHQRKVLVSIYDKVCKWYA